MAGKEKLSFNFCEGKLIGNCSRLWLGSFCHAHVGML